MNGCQQAKKDGNVWMGGIWRNGNAAAFTCGIGSNGGLCNLSPVATTAVLAV
jgi:hypothetical protein